MFLYPGQLPQEIPTVYVFTRKTEFQDLNIITDNILNVTIINDNVWNFLLFLFLVNMLNYFVQYLKLESPTHACKIKVSHS